MHDGSDAAPDRSATSRRLVLNPTSGRGKHVDRAHRLADEYGFDVVETQRRGHGVELARGAVEDGVELLGVCGGDGTLHEVVVGLYECGELDSVTVCIVPAGTENIVAKDLGVDSLERGFEVAIRGQTRAIDLGVVGDEPFVMSAIGGLPADVSEAATHELKREVGPLAFVVGAIEEGLAFDGLAVEVDAHSGAGEVAWSGEVVAVLVGNLRRFGDGGGQADAEDGLLEVTIVEALSPGEMFVEAIEQRLLHEETPHVTELRTPRLAVTPLDGDPVTYSLDGEIGTFESVEFGVRPGALSIKVGSGYEPSPSRDGG